MPKSKRVLNVRPIGEYWKNFCCHDSQTRIWEKRTKTNAFLFQKNSLIVQSYCDVDTIHSSNTTEACQQAPLLLLACSITLSLRIACIPGECRRTKLWSSLTSPSQSWLAQAGWNPFAGSPKSSDSPSDPTSPEPSVLVRMVVYCTVQHQGARWGHHVGRAPWVTQ